LRRSCEVRTEPERQRATEITKYRGHECKVYGSRRARWLVSSRVSSSIDSAANAALDSNALGMGVGNRNPTGEIIRTDHGGQFT